MARFELADLRAIVESCVGTDNVEALDEEALDVRLDDLGLDSLAVYEVATRLQDEFGVTITDEEIDTMKTPRLMLSFVNARVAAAA